MRERILQLYDRKKSDREIADILRRRRTASAPATPRARHPRTASPFVWPHTLLTEKRKERLLQLLAERPDATLAELGSGMDRRFHCGLVALASWVGRIKNSVRHQTKSSRRS